MLGSQSSLTGSKQLYHLKLEGGKCELTEPASGLTAHIEYFWLLTIEQPSVVLEIIPDTAIDLVLSPDIPDFAALYFPVSKKFSINLAGPVRYAGVCFRSASAAEILRLDFNSLTQLNLGVDTIEALQIRPLLADIQRSTSVAAIADSFDKFWLAQLGKVRNPTSSRSKMNHQELIDVLEGSVGSDNIANICETLGVSERQFRRLSNELFGMSPKKLQNIMRLQLALNDLFRCEAGQIQDLYYDDSHRIRELKRLTGFTPSQIREMAEKYNSI